MDVAQAMTPAFNRTVEMLFRPFNYRKWLGLGFASLLAYSGGGNSHFNVPSGDSGSPSPAEIPTTAQVQHWIMAHLPIIIGGVVALVLIALVFTWLSSVFRLVNVEQIARNTGEIRAPFSRSKHLGLSFALWQLGFGLVILILIGVLAAPVVWVWLAAGSLSVGAKIAITALCVLLFIALVIFAAIVGIFGADFVLPTMWVKRIRVLDAWSVVLPIIRQNMTQMFLYLLLLIVIAIGSSIVSLLVMIPVVIVFAIPGVPLGFVGYGIYKSTHTWSPALTTYIATVGTIFLLAFIYGAACALQPVYVFRRSFSLAVLGQADPSLVTIANGLPPAEPGVARP